MSDITYINKDLLMEGTLESKEGQVIIAGTFKGNITAKSLIIESTCKFHGNINSEHVRVEAAEGVQDLPERVHAPRQSILLLHLKVGERSEPVASDCS